MIFWKRRGYWKDRKRKEIKLILLYGNPLLPNILCAGKARGAKASPDGISNAPQCRRNIWALTLIFMEVEWICSFHIMKARLHKVLFAIMKHRQNTGCTII